MVFQPSVSSSRVSGTPHDATAVAIDSTAVFDMEGVHMVRGADFAGRIASKSLTLNYCFVMTGH